ncbi:hypothetical protein FQA47_007951 [Oryzias melastigma]|uniref:Uncharacterized protein n=1 Tax=Oryzias melastigma TaxID=30732 RepID=A0A834BRR3_ORYME|nr:hypothetical protein FQA47_007951 [Oryzias melastigma]
MPPRRVSPRVNTPDLTLDLAGVVASGVGGVRRSLKNRKDAERNFSLPSSHHHRDRVRRRDPEKISDQLAVSSGLPVFPVSVRLPPPPQRVPSGPSRIVPAGPGSHECMFMAAAL